MQKIDIYDTTLRDGAQSEDISLSVADRLKIATKLDELGIDYIEGGWPGANPADTEFFQEMQNYSFKNAKLSAFGSTHHPNVNAEDDNTLNNIIAAHPNVACIFGKACEVHAKEALRLSPTRNLEIIKNSVAYLKQNLSEVFFDAEHFFDGLKHNAEYTLSTLKAAHESGADVLVLCDTNGGTMPHEVSEAVKTVKERLPNAKIGIHAHNDCEMAVANSLAAVEMGATQVQGTINGVGERCGNANLISVIPCLNLKYKNKYQTISAENLALLRATSIYVSEVCNISPFSRQAFVGLSAFAHKGGIHVSAVNRNSSLYEHIDPNLIGNRQRVLLTEFAGRSNIVFLAKRFGFHLDKDEPVVKGLLNELKIKSSQGYDFAAAEASIELLILRKLARCGVREFFKLKHFRVLESKMSANSLPLSEASVVLEVEGIEEHTAASGLGPINALDNALRKALINFYPRLNEMRLVDFKVRVLNASENSTGSGSFVRVLIESADQNNKWVTVGVSYNIIEASWQALADSVIYKLYKDEYEHRQQVK
ncbi:citramalate synthase [Desulfovibrio litoralis]|uniref:Citramalate synthase n=1 Tax=Desulfovibrio litoralis DSM 11393 TaxID=1121455 RepID=A0A1M7SAS8_9BACT|nr:citramalate synthase [Desulfovibrio litoralis]SHN55586.1 (R)-citramalate synthase [Desulfovibrio litoralis DSM 11393]